MCGGVGVSHPSTNCPMVSNSCAIHFINSISGCRFLYVSEVKRVTVTVESVWCGRVAVGGWLVEWLVAAMARGDIRRGVSLSEALYRRAGLAVHVALVLPDQLQMRCPCETRTGRGGGSVNGTAGPLWIKQIHLHTHTHTGSPPHRGIIDRVDTTGPTKSKGWLNEQPAR